MKIVKLKDSYSDKYIYVVVQNIAYIEFADKNLTLIRFNYASTEAKSNKIFVRESIEEVAEKIAK
jgi:hypothetical protein